MGCKYVKEFDFGSDKGYTGSAGKTPVRSYMRGGAVKSSSLDVSTPKQTPTNMKPLRTANAKTSMSEANKKGVMGASGKIKTAGQYAEGGAACACGGRAMKKGGKSKMSKAEKKMAEGLVAQMARQAMQTGRMPGMPAPRARSVPVAPQSPLVAMKKGGSKVGKVMGEYDRGELHSGSKNGPAVKSRKQALAIALSEARK